MTIINPDARREADNLGIPQTVPSNGLLAGLPFSVKDAFKTARLRTTSSHPALVSYVPQVNAAAVERLLRAGAILIGKTNLPKLAADAQCRSPLFGTTCNPWDLEKTSGGSSGGGAVAVSLGFSWFDLGSDFAGSIRVPASFCGVVGFKASSGRIATDGHIPPLPNSSASTSRLLAVGLLTRRVEDAHIGLRALTSSFRKEDQPTRHEPLPGSHAKAGLKFAYWDDLDGIPLCSQTQRVLRRTVTQLARAGHTIERKRPENFDLQSLWLAFGTIAGAETGFISNRLLRSILSAFAGVPSKDQPITRGMLAGLSLNPSRYNDALRIRAVARQQLDHFLSSYDAWILPSVPCVAFGHMRRFDHTGIARLRYEENSLPYLEGAFSCTALFSLTGNPVLTIPCCALGGLPVGLQFVGRFMLDEQLIRTCSLIEDTVGGYQAPPLLTERMGVDMFSRAPGPHLIHRAAPAPESCAQPPAPDKRC